MHLRLCTVLVWLTVASAGASTMAQPTAVQPPLIAVVTASALDTPATDSTAAEGTLVNTTADLASDLPELLLTLPLVWLQHPQRVQALGVHRLALPYPFLEQPQRPPRAIA